MAINKVTITGAFASNPKDTFGVDIELCYPKGDILLRIPDCDIFLKKKDLEQVLALYKNKG